MPNTKSAIKAARQNLRHRKINLVALEKIRKATKQVRKFAAANNKPELSKALSEAFSSLDKATKKHIIHKNTASRKKSRLAKLVAKVK